VYVPNDLIYFFGEFFSFWLGVEKISSKNVEQKFAVRPFILFAIEKLAHC